MFLGLSFNWEHLCHCLNHIFRTMIAMTRVHKITPNNVITGNYFATGRIILCEDADVSLPWTLFGPQSILHTLSSIIVLKCLSGGWMDNTTFFTSITLISWSLMFKRLQHHLEISLYFTFSWISLICAQQIVSPLLNFQLCPPSSCLSWWPYLIFHWGKTEDIKHSHY